MASILNRMFRRDRQEPLPKVSIMGLDDAGKSTILAKVASTPITTTIPTIGMHIETANITTQASKEDGKISKRDLNAWTCDVGGCSKLGPLIRGHFVGAGMVWVINANDKDRFAESVEELTRLLPKLTDIDAGSASEVPVALFLTKLDLPGRKDTARIRAMFRTVLDGRTHAWFETYPTATLADSGLAEAFAWLGEALASPASATTVEEKPSLPEAEKAANSALADMRSPSALSKKLDEWLSRAETDVPAEAFLQQLYAYDLPNWDHYTHLRLAYILLLKHGRREGKDKIFTRFKDYINNSGKIHGKSFHLTMTYFWVQMVHLGIASMDINTNAHSLVSEGQSGDLDDFATFLTVNQYLVDGQLWADYYSKEVLMSKEAKEGVVFPDIKGLPDVIASTPARYKKKAVPAGGVTVMSWPEYSKEVLGEEAR